MTQNEPVSRNDDGAISRRQFLSGVAGAGVAGLAVGGVAGGFIGAAIEGEGDEQAVGAGAAPAKGPIVIGLPLAQSGPVTADHKDHENGTLLAVKEINEAGGVAGRKIDTLIVDIDAFSPEGTANSFRRLVDAEVDAISSPFVVIPPPAYDVVAPYGAPYLNGNTSQPANDLVASDPEKYSMVFSDAGEVWYGKDFVPFLDALEASGKWKPRNRAIHIIESDVPYTQVISAETQKGVQNSGGEWEVSEVTKIVTPTNDWGPVISKLQGTNSGVVMLDHFVAAEEAAFTKQFVANSTDSLVYIQYAPSQPEFLAIAGEAANGFVWSSVLGVLADDIGQAFRQRYIEEYDPKVMGLAYTGFGYDVVHILARAWGLVGDPRDFGAVNDVIRSSVYRGTVGSYYFKNPGQAMLVYPEQTPDPSIGAPHLFYQVHNGEHKIISPLLYAEAEFDPAPWQSA